MIITESHTCRVNDLCRICGTLCAITHKQKKNFSTVIKETIIKQTQILTNNPFLTDKAHTIQIIFDDLNSAFRAVHKFISHTAPVDDSPFTRHSNRNRQILDNLQHNLELDLGLWLIFYTKYFFIYSHLHLSILRSSFVCLSLQRCLTAFFISIFIYVFQSMSIFLRSFRG